MHLDSNTRTAITVNGERTETQARTLAELVAAGGFAETQVATALNGDFVARGCAGRNSAQLRATRWRSWRRGRAADKLPP